MVELNPVKQSLIIEAKSVAVYADQPATAF